VERFLERAASVTPSPGYVPTPAAIKLADVLFTAGAPTFVELAAQAGISRTALYDLLKSDDAVVWITAHGTGVAAAGLGFVHARLLELALHSRSPAAIELFLKRFDKGYQPAGPTTQTNIQTNNLAFVSSMSDQELRSYLQQKRRTSGKLEE
jgi:hypothetical protein